MHTSFPKGTPLFIRMKDGQVIIGKFKDHKSGKVLLEDGQVINIEEAKSMSIRKLETKVSSEKGLKVKFRTHKQ